MNSLKYITILIFSFTAHIGSAQTQHIVLRTDLADSSFAFVTKTGRLDSLANDAFKLQPVTINALTSMGYSAQQIESVQQLSALKIFDVDPRDTIVVSSEIMSQVSSSLNSLKEELESSAAARSAGGGSSPTSGESGDSETLVVMPSPSSLGLVNTGSDMVDLYTGDLNYSILLHNLKSRDLSVPISLSYSSRDVKVDNIASHVGLGWNLKAGGLITRVMRGLPDEWQGKINGTSGTSSNQFDGYGWLKLKSRTVNGKNIIIKDPNDFKNRFNVTQRKNVIENSALGGTVANLVTKTEGWDTEPDEFFFNFGKYSGKFVFTQDGDIKTIPYQNLDITKTVALLDGEDKIIEFVVKTPDGMTYTFGSSSPTNLDAVEESKLITHSITDVYSYDFLQEIPYFDNYGNYLISEYVYAPLPGIKLKLNGAGKWIFDLSNPTAWTYQYFTSTWHLKKIESQNDKITFNYKDMGEINYFQNRGESIRLPNLPRFGDGYFISLEAPINSAKINIFPEIQTHTRTFNEIFLKAKKLESIQTSVGSKAYFDSNVTRKDFIGDTRLDKIRIVQGTEEIVSYQFDYMYTTAESEGDFVTPGVFEGQLIVPQVTLSNIDFLFSEDLRLLDSKAKLFPEFSVSDFDQYLKLFEAEHERLQLRSITEYQNRFNKMPATTFIYNSTSLPRRFSTQQDVWGYYNRNNRGTLIPKVAYNSILTGYPQINSGIIMWDKIRLTGSVTINDIINKWICESGDCSRNGAIRGPHSTRFKASVLDKINHPLGGATNLIYSRKKGASGPMIVAIDHSPIVGASSTIKQSFIYSNAIAPKTPGFKYSLKSSNIHRSYIFSSHALNSAFLTKGSHVGFDRVSVSQEGKGKTQYEFETTIDIPNDPPVILEYNSGESSVSGRFPYPPEENDWRRGRISKISYFRQGESLPIVTRNFNYELADPDYVYGFKPGMYGWRSTNVSFPAYRAAFYKYNSSVYRIMETIESTADERDLNSLITNTSTYSYVIGHPQYERSVTTTYQDGSSNRVDKTYAFDYFEEGESKPSGMDRETEGLWLLTAGRFLDTTIETVSLRKESAGDPWQVTGASLNTFQKGSRFGSNTNGNEVYLMESKTLGLANSINENEYTFSSLLGVKTDFNFDSRYMSALIYNDYNSFGRPLRSSGREGVLTQIDWTHYNSLISAVTENSTGNLIMKSSYTHKPLVGITQSKDVNNKRTNYQYDSRNRLYLRRDNNNRIIDRYRYNYQNEEQVNISTSINITGGINLICSGIQFTSTNNVNATYGEPSYSWDFGDLSNTAECSGPKGGIDGFGVQSKGKSVYHRFSEPGFYTVTLTLSHPEYGQTIKRSISVTVYALRAPLKINGSSTVDNCGSGGGQDQQTIDPIDGPPDGDGSTPTTYFSIGWETNGARCYTPGEQSTALKYRKSGGSWITFSTERYGSLPAEAFHSSTSSYDIEIMGELVDYCSTGLQVAYKVLTVNPCTSSGSGGGTGQILDQN